MSDELSLTCPRCNVPINELRTSGGVLYGCDLCGGRAVTIELLRKRFTPESFDPLWQHAMRGEGRPGLPCPLCRQPMIGGALPDRAEIYVDVCHHCHLSGSTLTKLTRSFRVSPSRPLSNPNSRKKRARCSP